MEKLYQFLWYFSYSNESERFKNKLKRFEEQVGFEKAVVCLIFEISEIKEVHSNFLVTEDGLMTFDGTLFKFQNQEVRKESNLLKWKENENEWILDLENVSCSKIIVKNDWKDESKEEAIFRMFGEFINEGFLHNSRFILNIKVFGDDFFDVWDIDECSYKIVRKGTTEIYPSFF